MNNVIYQIKRGYDQLKHTVDNPPPELVQFQMLTHMTVEEHGIMMRIQLFTPGDARGPELNSAHLVSWDDMDVSPDYNPFLLCIRRIIGNLENALHRG